MNNYKEKQKKNSKFIKQLRKKPTRAEIMVGKFLVGKKIYFIYQKGFLVPFHRIVDFYFPGRFLILEVDGKYHETIKGKDDRKDFLWANNRAISTLRIKNEEVFDGTFKEKLLESLGDSIQKDYKSPKCPPSWRN